MTVANGHPGPVGAAQLRDVIAEHVWHSRLYSDCGHRCADDILASPEMQAIKKALRDNVASIGGLPHTVIEWALS